jgi:hypothetical protein
VLRQRGTDGHQPRRRDRQPQQHPRAEPEPVRVDLDVEVDSAGGGCDASRSARPDASGRACGDAWLNASHARLTAPEPGNRSSKLSCGAAPRRSNSQRQNAAGLAPITRPGRVVSGDTPHTRESTRRVASVADRTRRIDKPATVVDDRFPRGQRTPTAGWSFAAMPRRDPHSRRARRSTAGSAAAEVDSAHPS